ncbi:MAG: hypothetical protein ABJE10_12750 [bacterium]
MDANAQRLVVAMSVDTAMLMYRSKKKPREVEVRLAHGAASEMLGGALLK